MTNLILGRALILDFDGTITSLPVAWADLRASLGVMRIGDLWSQSRSEAWETIRKAEEEAAELAVPNHRLVAAMQDVLAFAVLTNNAETCVSRFLERHSVLRDRVVAIIGRETLAGPKRDFAIFEKGLRRCAEATCRTRNGEPVVYVGDMDYELDYARRLGAWTFHVDSLGQG